MYFLHRRRKQRMKTISNYFLFPLCFFFSISNTVDVFLRETLHTFPLVRFLPSHQQLLLNQYHLEDLEHPVDQAHQLFMLRKQVKLTWVHLWFFDRKIEAQDNRTYTCSARTLRTSGARRTRWTLSTKTEVVINITFHHHMQKTEVYIQK